MNLLETISPSWRKTPELAEILRVGGIFAGRLAADFAQFVAQLSVDTATVGMEGWERALGIQTDLSLSLDWRRRKVKAKLQGLGVTTPEVICSIVEGFTGGTAHVEEYPAEYKFRVVVDGVLNQPENMDVMRHSVAEIKPAHLAHEYALRYQSGRLPVRCAMAAQQVIHHYYRLEART